MKKLYSKCLLTAAVFIAAVLLFFFPTDKAYAYYETSGNVTDTITYTFNGSTGALVVSETGVMPDALKESLSQYNITWKTSEELGEESEKAFAKTTYSVSSGEVVQLTLSDGTFTDTGFTFVTGDPTVAVVSVTGEVLGCKNGTTTITGIYDVTGQEFTCSVTVSGYTAPEGMRYINGITTSALSADINLDCFNEKANGYYYLAGSELYFVSFAGLKEEPVYNFYKCHGSYINGDILYVCTDTNGSSVIAEYDLAAQKFFKTVKLDVADVSAVGVDDSGNIYVYYKGDEEIIGWIAVFSAEGELLTQTDAYSQVYYFSGFDTTNGNFYTEFEYNYRTGEYDYYCHAVASGNYSKGVLTYSNDVISPESGTDYYGAYVLFREGLGYDVVRSVKLMGGRYLVAASTEYACLYRLDSNNYTSGTGITSDTSSFIWRLHYAEDAFYIGTRTAYYDANGHLIVYMNNGVVKEIDPVTGKIYVSVETIHRAFSMDKVGDLLYIIETDDDGNKYIEALSWKAPTYLTVNESVALKVGETTLLTTESDTLSPEYIFTSSDNTIASVTTDGKVIAWKEGSVTITVSINEYSISNTCVVTVTSNPAHNKLPHTSYTLGGSKTNNISANSYFAWSAPMKSYLYQNSDGSYVRVQYTEGVNLLVETYSSAFTLVSTKTVTLPYNRFGGFYHGEDGYNYVVCGQANYDESDSLEVVRVIRYNSDFTSPNACSLKGINTYIPFEAGSCRMTETDGKLYVYTCHTMYDFGDGLHHQANMTFVIDKTHMSLLDSYYDAFNNSVGYVSHSFNQFITTDGEYIYRADHGDGHPRGLYLSKTRIDRKVSEPLIYGTFYYIQGDFGNNATGVCLGGFELADDNLIAALNSVDMSDEDSYNPINGTRNIFITVIDNEKYEARSTQLTYYDNTSNTMVNAPQLVKIDDSHFLIMWEEVTTVEKQAYDDWWGYYTYTDYEYKTRLALIDSDGTLCSGIVSSVCRLSDCQPIINDKGFVTWYVTDGEKGTFYTYDPYHLSDAGAIEIVTPTLNKETLTLMEGESETLKVTVSPEHASNTKVTWSSSDTSVASVDENGKVTALKEGSATITVTSVLGNKAASCVVTVKKLSEKIKRIFGASRFDTSIAAAEELKTVLGAEKFDTIVVASGTGFADALAGSYLAAVKNAPVLLVADGRNGTVMKQMTDYIKENLAEGGTIYVLGGTGAVSALFEEYMGSDYTESITRFAGSDRYETNLMILNEAGVQPGDDILICTGTGFADSLSASATGKAILLVPNRLLDSQKEFLEGLNGESRLYIIGGTGAVSASVEKELAAYGTVTRIGGADRFETSANLARTFFDNPENVVLAYAANYPDGLSAGPLAYASGAPLILTQNAVKATPAAVEYRNEIADEFEKMYVMGGETLISNSTAQLIYDGQ